MRSLLFAFLVFGVSAAHAYVPGAPQHMICPVGGESFMAPGAPLIYSTNGARPDGKPYSRAPMPPPLAECPTNRLVVFRSFSSEEVSELAQAILSPEYGSLTAHETQYYRAAWLAHWLDPHSAESQRLLRMAIWEADVGSALRARYLREFAERGSALPLNMEDLEAVDLHLRAANAFRELGEFEEALRMLRLVDRSDLDVAVPEEVRRQIDANTHEILNSAQLEEARQRRSLLQLLDGEEVATLARDASIDPLVLVPDDIAAFRCIGLTERELSTPPAREVCSSPSVVHFIGYYRSNGIDRTHVRRSLRQREQVEHR